MCYRTFSNYVRNATSVSNEVAISSPTLHKINVPSQNVKTPEAHCTIIPAQIVKNINWASHNCKSSLSSMYYIICLRHLTNVCYVCIYMYKRSIF